MAWRFTTRGGGGSHTDTKYRLDERGEGHIQHAGKRAARRAKAEIDRYGSSGSNHKTRRILSHQSCPIESIYRWKGKVENAQEWLCLIKTRDDLYNKVETAIKKLHSYETPEIIAMPVVKGSKEYLSWIEDSLF